MASVPALELDTEASGYTRSDGVHFGGFPGVWIPGQPIEITELGFESGDEALARVRDLDLPLVEVKVDSGSAPMTARPNHLFSEDQQRVLDLQTSLPASKKRWTHDELDALAKEADITWPGTVKKIDEKVAFLDAVRAGTITSAGEPVNENEEDDREETA